MLAEFGVNCTHISSILLFLFGKQEASLLTQEKLIAEPRKTVERRVPVGDKTITREDFFYAASVAEESYTTDPPPTVQTNSATSQPSRASASTHRSRRTRGSTVAKETVSYDLEHGSSSAGGTSHVSGKRSATCEPTTNAAVVHPPRNDESPPARTATVPTDVNPLPLNLTYKDLGRDLESVLNDTDGQ